MQPPSGPQSTPTPSPSQAPDPRGEDFDISTLPASSGGKKWLPANWHAAWLAAAGVLLVLFVWLAAFSQGLRSQKPMPLPIATSSAVPTTPTLVTVQVAGSVARPGVYSVNSTARIVDAINQAGGLTPNSDTSSLNMAAYVQDGTMIMVPSRSALLNQTPAPPSTPDASSASTALPPNSPNGAPSPTGTLSPAAASREAQIEYLRAHPIDLNTASSFELQQLPGVGPAMAAEIIAYRTANGRFRSVSDLDNVKGIGEKRMELLKDLVVVH